MPGIGIDVRLPRRRTWFAMLTAVVVTVILFLCLSPFRFSIRHGDINAVGALVGSWAKPPDPIDFALNIVLYVPLGVFGALSSSPRLRRPWRRVVLVTASGAVLSIAVELIQYFDAARYTTATDVYANVLGTFLGATAVIVLFRW